MPLAFIVIGTLDADDSSPTLVRILLVLLLVARIMHPIGMFAAANTPHQFAFRSGGIIVTMLVLVLVVAAIALLVRLA